MRGIHQWITAHAPKKNKKKERNELKGGNIMWKTTRQSMSVRYTSDQIAQFASECIQEFQGKDYRERQNELVTLMKCYREGNDVPHPIDYFQVLTADLRLSFNLYEKEDGNYAYLNPADLIKVGTQRWRMLIYVNTSPRPFQGKTPEAIKQLIRRVLIHETVHALQLLNGDSYEEHRPYTRRYCEREAENVAIFYYDHIHPSSTSSTSKLKKESLSHRA